MKASELTAAQYDFLREKEMIGDEGLPESLYSCPGVTKPTDWGPETSEQCTVVDGAPFVSAALGDVCPKHGMRFEGTERVLTGTRLV